MRNWERGAGSGERGAGSGKQARRAGKMKNGNKLRIGNEVTDRARVQVRFRSHFHFPVLRARSSFLVPRFNNIPSDNS